MDWKASMAINMDAFFDPQDIELISQADDKEIVDFISGFLISLKNNYNKDIKHEKEEKLESSPCEKCKKVHKKTLLCDVCKETICESWPSFAYSCFKCHDTVCDECFHAFTTCCGVNFCESCTLKCCVCDVVVCDTCEKICDECDGKQCQDCVKEGNINCVRTSLCKNCIHKSIRELQQMLSN